MKKGIIVQARLGASRLPSKIKLQISNDTNLIDYQLLNLVTLSIPIVVAMPDTQEHKDFAKSLKSFKTVNFFFGNENNVLKRFLDCGKEYSFESIIRVCGDNPFLNIGFIKNLINQWAPVYDYASYYNSNSLPAMKTHFGLFAEIINIKALEKIYMETKSRYFIEHVTPYIYENPQWFRIKRLNMPEPFFTGLPLRLTVDTQMDIDMVRNIANNVENTQDVTSILAYCKLNGLLEIMKREINQNQK